MESSSIPLAQRWILARPDLLEVNISEVVADLDSRQCPSNPPTVLFLEWERNFRCAYALPYVVKYWWAPWVTVAVYVTAVVVGRRLMDARGKPFDLRRPLVAWNATLALFSIAGALRTSELYFLVHRIGLKNALLHNGYSGCAQCTWAVLFLLSKFWELGDTAFIVLRRRPVTFLHVYHHATVLLFTYFMSSLYETTSGLLPQFMAINYSIHALMYSYFTLMALRIRVPKPIAIAITCCQIAQMLYGLYVTAAMYQYTKATGLPTELKVSIGVYASYTVLFVNFFIQAYFVKRKNTNKDQESQAAVDKNGHGPKSKKMKAQ